MRPQTNPADLIAEGVAEAREAMASAAIEVTRLRADKVGLRRELSDANRQARRIEQGIEAICQERETTPLTCARLRSLLAGVDWRKAR